MAVALSQVTPTQRSPIPRMVKLELVKFDFVKETLGSVSCKSLAFSICWASRASASKALTAMGTSCSDWFWRWAVTIMTFGPIRRLSRSSSGVSCAKAGNEIALAQIPASREALTLINPLLSTWPSIAAYGPIVITHSYARKRLRTIVAHMPTYFCRVLFWRSGVAIRLRYGMLDSERCQQPIFQTSVALSAIWVIPRLPASSRPSCTNTSITLAE